MIGQPLFSILLYFWPFEGLHPTLILSTPLCCLPISFSVCLSFSLLVQCPVGSSLQVLLILFCAHTISVCVSSQCGNWLAPHDCVHGVLVNKKTNTIFMSVLFATEIKLMSILSSCFAKVPPSYLTESKNTPAISSHLMSKFFQLSRWSQCSHIPRSNVDIGSCA